MDLLQRELERKRQALIKAKQEQDPSASSSSSSKKRKFLRQKDLRRIEEEEEEERQRQLQIQLQKEREQQQQLLQSQQQSKNTVNIQEPKKKKRKKDKKNNKKSKNVDKDDAVTTTTTTNDNNNNNTNDTNATGGTEISSSASSTAANNNSNTTATLFNTLEITKQLRSFGLPIVYFGESIEQRWKRLQQALEEQTKVLQGLSEKEEFRLGKGHGIRNTFLDRKSNNENEIYNEQHENLDGMKKKEKQQLQQQQQQLGGGKKKKDSTTTSATGTTTTEKDQNVNHHNNNNNDKDKHDDTKNKNNNNINNHDDANSDNDHKTNDNDHDNNDNNDDDDNDSTGEKDPPKFIYKYLKGLLKEWEYDLSLRSDVEIRSVIGRNDTKTFKQCKDYIRPLFKLLKSRKLEVTMQGQLVKIVQYCKQGEFVKAHDTYMDLAIGRAAWPIGVTMVGIHARSGRAKIESSNVAHVMNSELQRKYLTSVKRLLSFAQKKRPDVDPSKKVS